MVGRAPIPARWNSASPWSGFLPLLSGV